VLHAALADGTEVVGQSRIARTSGIERVWLTPEVVRASEDAVAAIGEADLIVIGPGSLFTSVMPSLLLPEIRDAIASSSALRVYVCNVATQPGETAGYDLAAHVEALERHASEGLVDVVLANSRMLEIEPRVAGSDGDVPYASGGPVQLRWPPSGDRPPRLVLDDLVDRGDPHHHDPARLAAALVRIADRDGAARRGGGRVGRIA